MNRRQAVSVLVCGAAAPPARAAALDRLLEKGAAAALVELSTGRVIAMANETVQAPPGSTVKPLVLAALLRRGRLKPDEGLLCRGRLRIGGRVFDCVHPPMDVPLRVDAALAYSCNSYVAHFALRLTAAELASELRAAGLSAVRPASSEDGVRLQALGEGVLTTPLELALAYRKLAEQTPAPIQEGMGGAVDYGTAQRARVAGLRVAGKTGSARNTAGELIAWFAGFAPQVALAVMVRGRSGGADAAPVAAKILEAWKAGRL